MNSLPQILFLVLAETENLGEQQQTQIDSYL